MSLFSRSFPRLAVALGLSVAGVAFSPSLYAAKVGAKAKATCDASLELDQDLIQAVTFLIGGGKPSLLAPAIVQSLESVSELASGGLSNRENLDVILEALRARVTPTQFDETLGLQLGGVRRALKSTEQKNRDGLEDHLDTFRSWGWMLLSREDPIFSDPKFLADMVRQTAQTGGGQFLRADPSDAAQQFQIEWTHLAPGTKFPRVFTVTGTDANLYAFEIAKAVVALRQKKKNFKDAQDAEILYFEGIYGGGRGRMNPIHHGDPEFRIESPHSKEWDPQDPKEIARLDMVEQRALQQIEDKITQSRVPIGAFLLESVRTAHGVGFYRPAFLAKVSELCHKHGVAVVADEIMTGGGRTGKFFAYENYPGFKPDFVTFGKGLQVAGITITQDSKFWEAYERISSGPVTLLQHTEVLLKAAHIMRRIRTGNLMQNAAEMGRYIVESFKTAEYWSQLSGLGLVLGSQNGSRHLPVLSITKEQADEFRAWRRPLIED